MPKKDDNDKGGSLFANIVNDNAAIIGTVIAGLFTLALIVNVIGGLF